MVFVSSHATAHDNDHVKNAQTLADVIHDMLQFTCQETCLVDLADACHVSQETAAGSPGPVCVECINKCLKRPLFKLPPTAEEIQRNEWSWMRFTGQLGQAALCDSFDCSETMALEGNWNGLKCIGYEDWERKQNPISAPDKEPITPIGEEFKKIATLYQQAANILKTVSAKACVNLTLEAHPEGYHAQKMKRCLDLRYAGLVHYISSIPGASFHSALRQRYALQYPTSDIDDCDKGDWLIL